MGSLKEICKDCVFSTYEYELSHSENAKVYTGLVTAVFKLGASLKPNVIYCAITLYRIFMKYANAHFNMVMDISDFIAALKQYMFKVGNLMQASYKYAFLHLLSPDARLCIPKRNRRGNGLYFIFFDSTFFNYEQA